MAYSIVFFIFYLGRRESSRGHASRGGGGGGGGGRGGQRSTPPGSRTTPPPRHDRYDHRDSHNEDYRYNRWEMSSDASPISLGETDSEDLKVFKEPDLGFEPGSGSRFRKICVLLTVWI